MSQDHGHMEVKAVYIRMERKPYNVYSCINTCVEKYMHDQMKISLDSRYTHYYIPLTWTFVYSLRLIYMAHESDTFLICSSNIVEGLCMDRLGCSFPITTSISHEKHISQLGPKIQIAKVLG